MFNSNYRIHPSVNASVHPITILEVINNMGDLRMITKNSIYNPD